MAGAEDSQAESLLRKHADLLNPIGGTLCNVEASGRRALIEALEGKASDKVIARILEREGILIRHGSLQRHRTRECRCRR